MDIYKVLREDHTKVKGLFKELEDTTERALKTREHLFAKLKMELTIHSEAEEKFLYPRLTEAEVSREITLEGIEEHSVVKKLLVELDDDPKDTEEWAAKLKVLRENVEHHVKEEEGEMFQKARKVLSEEEAEAIADEVEMFKQEYSEMEEQA